MKQYKKLGLLGEGSHAKVYLVENEDNEKYALKEFCQAREGHLEAQCRFLVEKTALEKVNCLNITKIVDSIETDDQLAIIMELCEFGSLKAQLKKKGQFTLRKSLKAGISILLGLEAMHFVGILHRDIKPDNIIQGEKGILKLADMGLAKGTGYEITHCQGTVAYMSPEQYANYNKVDERSDIYSVGSTLYHLYTNEQLFGGDNIKDILDSHKNCIVPSLKSVRQDCPLSFNHAIRKMIAKNPADRYQTASEARLDFEAILGGAMEIKDLPSIQKFKQLTDTNINLPENEEPNKKAIPLIAAAVLLISGIILLAVFSKNNTQVTESSENKEKVLIQKLATEVKSLETVSEPETISIELPREVTTKAETKKLDKVKKLEEPKKAQVALDIQYKGPYIKPFPYTLTKISNNLLECTLAKNNISSKYQYGVPTEELTVLKIGRDYIIIDLEKEAYKLQLNKQENYFTGIYLVDINGESKTISKNSPLKKFTLLKGSDQNLALTNNGKNTLIENSNTEPTKEYLKPLKSDIREKLLASIQGEKISFVKRSHTYFPFLLSGITSSSITVTNDKGLKTKHRKSEILLKRLQLINISTNSAEFKDIRTSKAYTLVKDKRFILRKAVLLSYKGKKHLVQDQTFFFGYKITITKDITLQANDQADIVFNKIAFLPVTKIKNSLHLEENCSCYKIPLTKKVEEVITVTKPPILTVVNTPQLHSSATIPEPMQIESTQKTGVINLDYLVKFCDIKVKKYKIENRETNYKDLGNFRYTLHGFLSNSRQSGVNSDNFIYREKKLKLQNVKFRKNSANILHAPMDNFSGYSLALKPNNYWSFKRLIKACSASAIISGDIEAVYSFKDSIIKKGNRREKLQYSFDDTEQTLIINKVAHTIVFGLYSIQLTGGTHDITIKTDSSRIMGMSWVK